MDKWQMREAERLAADEGISVEEARGRLFPADAPAAKVDTSKGKA